MRGARLGLVAFVLAAALAGGCGEGSDGSDADASAVLRAEVVRYRSYLEDHGSVLVRAVTRLDKEIAAGDSAEARFWYPIARVHFSSVEPMAMGDPRMYRRLESGAAGLGRTPLRFHRIEKGVAADEVAGLHRPAALLRDDVEELQRYLETAPIEPMALLANAKRLMHLVATVKISGGWERYSPFDMDDVAANVEGAQSAARVALPCLAESWAGRIEKRFDELYAELMEFGFMARESIPPDWRAGSYMHSLGGHSRAERRSLRARLGGAADVLAAADKAAPAECPSE